MPLQYASCIYDDVSSLALIKYRNLWQKLHENEIEQPGTEVK